MKKVLLLVAVAISAVGYSQDVAIPNLKIKTDSFNTYQTVGFVNADSVWYSYDSLTLEFNKCQNRIYGVPDTTTGYYLYDVESIDSLVGSEKNTETFKFNFKDSTLTRVSLGGRRVEHISSVFEVNNSPGEYYVYVVNRDNYERLYKINLTNHTIQCSTYLKDVIRFSNLANRVYNVSRVTVKP